MSVVLLEVHGRSCRWSCCLAVLLKAQLAELSVVVLEARLVELSEEMLAAVLEVGVGGAVGGSVGGSVQACHQSLPCFHPWW